MFNKQFLIDYILVYDKGRKKSSSCEKKTINNLSPRLQVDLLLKNNINHEIGKIELLSNFGEFDFGILINKIQ